MIEIFTNILNGGRDISHLPFRTQKLIHRVVRMKNRIEFGTVVLDGELDDETKDFIECYQIAIDRKNSKT